MASYVELIRQDVHLHEPCEDGSSWPPSVSQFVEFLKKEFKIPGWLKSGPVPFTNRRAIDLLDQLRASNTAPNVDLWDDSDEIVDKEMQERLHVVFNSALADCARIRSVVQTEYITDTPYPKESFIVILLREAILDAHPRISLLEDVSVVLPRHFSGEVVPILSYMTKSLCVPFVISVYLEKPAPAAAEESEADTEHQCSDQEESSEETELFRDPPPTMSEFLDACEPKTPVEVEEEPVTYVFPPQFDAHFVARAPSASVTIPSICHIPVLCMADEEQLPVVMSSLLYQRRMWHINHPMIGLEFAKYDTVLRLFVGWLEDEAPSERDLPRVHLLEVETAVELDLASPSAVLAFSRLLVGLEPYISGTRDSARHSVDTVFSETETRSPLSWRIDTDGRDPETSAVGKDVRNMVLQWAKNQSHSESESGSEE